MSVILLFIVVDLLILISEKHISNEWNFDIYRNLNTLFLYIYTQWIFFNLKKNPENDNYFIRTYGLKIKIFIIIIGTWKCLNYWRWHIFYGDDLRKVKKSTYCHFQQFIFEDTFSHITMSYILYCSVYITALRLYINKSWRFFFLLHNKLSIMLNTFYIYLFHVYIIVIYISDLYGYTNWTINITQIQLWFTCKCFFVLIMKIVFLKKIAVLCVESFNMVLKNELDLCIWSLWTAFWGSEVFVHLNHRLNKIKANEI